MSKIDINYFLNATATWKESMMQNYDKQFGAGENNPTATALHTHQQPKRKPLTDEEIAALLAQSAGVDLKLNGGDLLFARAIERAHGIGGKE